MIKKNATSVFLQSSYTCLVCYILFVFTFLLSSELAVLLIMLWSFIASWYVSDVVLRDHSLPIYMTIAATILSLSQMLVALTFWVSCANFHFMKSIFSGICHDGTYNFGYSFIAAALSFIGIIAAALSSRYDTHY